MQYTLEWSKKSSKFYFDGSLIATMNTNVPTYPSAFLWNSVSPVHVFVATREPNQFPQWSSGNPNWTGGPPTQDSILRISRIDVNYKTSSAQRVASTGLTFVALAALMSWTVSLL